MTESSSSSPESYLPEKVKRQKELESHLEVDLGSAGIVGFAPLGGYRLKNEGQLERREGLEVIEYPARGINQGNAGEVAYQNSRYEKGLTDRLIRPLQSPDFEVKIGILNFRIEGNTLVFDTKPGTFVMSNDDKNVGLQKPENVALRAELGIPLATAMIIITTEEDGSHKIISQHRTKANASYLDMLGAGVAGTNKHKLQKGEGRGKLEPLTDDDIKSFAATEMEEEIGVLPEELINGLDGIEFVGVGIDKRRVHLELLALAQVNMSAKQIAERAKANLNAERGAFNFAESVFVTNGSPEDIRRMLNMNTPIPPTHIAAFVAAGRSLILKEQREAAADEWVRIVSDEVRETTKRIDQIVREATNGEQPGYNPRKSPQAQGLLSAEQSLRDSHLLVEL